MPRYRFIYDGWQHGERHPDDRTAREAVDEPKIDRGLIRVERLVAGADADRGGSSPGCRDGAEPPLVEVVWRKGESDGDDG